MPSALIIDDDYVTQIAVQDYLEEAEFTVIEAMDAVTGVSLFKEHRPDIVLLDVEMPGKDGYTACREIRSLVEGKHTPIVMMTGYEDPESVDRAYDSGATDFVSKPMNFAILVHRIKHLIRASETSDQLRRSRASLAQAQRIAKLGSWELDLQTECLTLTDEAARLINCDKNRTDINISTIIDAVCEQVRECYENTFTAALKSGRNFDFDFPLKGNGEATVYIHQETLFERGQDGTPIRALGTFQDITESRSAQERIRQLAYFDPVTGLPNRSHFMDKLSEMLALAARHKRVMALMFVDLDQFKRVNDSWGHHVGDQLLLQVSQRLYNSLRTCDVISRFDDGDRSQLARLGGDEFVVLLSEIKQPEDTTIVARRLTTELKRPFLIEDTEVHISASIGISCYPNDGTDEQSLLRHADTAMYQVKEQGRNSFRFYESSMNKRTIERLSLENNLRRGLECGEFELHYQPKIAHDRTSIVGAEALLRWRHPDVGLVSPAEFIEVAEESGLIIPLGNWVLNQACKQISRWKDVLNEGFQISINISPVQFQQRDFLNVVKNTLIDNNTDPRRIQIEITERMLIEDTDRMIALLNSLREMGIEIAIDDFGTGYSSLSYLKRLPIDILKIDRSFVREMSVDDRDAGIISATITLSHHLGLRVTAEGVETKAQLDHLLEFGCDELQGYYFCAPVPADEFIRWITEYKSVAPPAQKIA